MFKNTFGAADSTKTKLNTSTSTAAKTSKTATTTRDSEIKSLRLPGGKFKTDP